MIDIKSWQKQFGYFIRWRRRLEGLSQEQFCLKHDLYLSRHKRIETGDVLVTLEDFYRLDKAIGFKDYKVTLPWEYTSGGIVTPSIDQVIADLKAVQKIWTERAEFVAKEYCEHDSECGDFEGCFAADYHKCIKEIEFYIDHYRAMKGV